MRSLRLPFRSAATASVAFFAPLLAMALASPSSVLFAQEDTDEASEAEGSGQAALTYERFPSYFHGEKPLTPESEILLRFNGPVAPGEIGSKVWFYDRNAERFVAVTATRPGRAEITERVGESEWNRRRAEDTPLEHFAVVRPREPLSVGATWHLYAEQGLASEDGLRTLPEGRIDHLATLNPFEINGASARVSYDEPLKIEINLNKSRLSPELEEADLTDFVSVEPRPENFQVEAGYYSLEIKGDFDYGVPYALRLRDGLVANDKTQLEQVYEETLEFEPLEGFVALPSHSTTQSASGHRRYEVRTGNLTGLRTRVKRLEGDELILALRDYEELYDGWGDAQRLFFEAVPGSTVFDEFRDAAGEIDRIETFSYEWDGIGADEDRGAFFLCSEGRSSTRADREVGAQTVVQLTDIGLAWKQADDATVLYAFSLLTGEPLAGTEVRLVDDNAQALFTARTDERGVASVDSERYREAEDERLFLDARREGDRHVMRFFKSLDSLGLWNFNIDQRYDDLAEGERRTLLFTDRNVYRPGEEVKVKAISRFIDTDRLLGPAPGPATLRVYDSRRRKLMEQEVVFGPGGSYDGSFLLPSAGMGHHAVEIDFNPRRDDEASEDDDEFDHHPDWRLVSSHSFRVEDYRVNTFEVRLEADPSYLATERIPVPLSASYYMGKPLSRSQLQWSYYAYTDFSTPRGFDEFQFGDRTGSTETASDEGSGRLSSSGEALIELELPAPSGLPAPRRVYLNAQVTDANQQTISNAASFVVHSSDFYLGLRAPEGVHRAGDTATYSLAAASSAGGAHTAPVDVSLLVEREIWNTVKVMGAEGRFTHRNDRHLETVTEERLVLHTELDPDTGIPSVQSHEIRFAEAGDYLVTLSGRDAAGRPVITRDRFTVIGATEPSWSWWDVLRIDLIPDRDRYEPGDTAKVLARSPVFGHALLTTERGGVRSTRSVLIEEHETVFEIPLDEGDAPNLFVSLLIVRGSGESPHVHASTDYRLGYCQLSVDDPATKLHVALDSGGADSHVPGEIVEVAATVTGSDGAPVAGAEVVLFAVDEGVLSLTGHATPDPRPLFHAAFPLAVSTGQSLRDLLPENPLEQDFTNKGYVIGGGGTPPGLDPDRVRKDFKALAFWEPTLVTGPDGTVRASFEAPDNLTTFRLMAVVAEGNRFGKGEAPLVINKPLMIEPALPGFTNLTDQVDLSAVLHNNTGSSQEVEITVRLDDHARFVSEIGENIPTTLGPATEADQVRSLRAVLDAGSTRTFALPVALVATGEAKWQWEVRSLSDPTLRDNTESTLAVGYPLPLLRETHSLVLRDGESLESALASVSPRLRDGTGTVTLTLANSRLVEAAEGLDYLLSYPYGCLEQTTSSLIPWLMTRQLRPHLPQLERGEAEIERTVRRGVETILSMQTSDGGLGYWPGAGASSLWTSAYGGLALALAAREGVEMSETRLELLWNHLSEKLRNTGEIEDAYELSQRALACYTLALAGRAEPAYHELLHESRRLLSGEARALLALAMIESGSDADPRVGDLLASEADLPVAQVSWFRQPYVAATRLLAELRRDPAGAAVEERLDELMRLREPLNGWGSTYSNAWPMIALAAYAEARAGSLAPNDVAVRFAGREETVSLPAEAGSGEVAFNFDGGLEPGDLALAPSGSSPVYVSLRVEARPELVAVEAENHGFGIARRYEKVEIDGSVVPLEDPRVGDLILVTLDLTVPNPEESFLAIDDALPAVLEAVNPNFQTQATQRVAAGRGARTLFANHREIRRDRVLFFADRVREAGDYRVQYLARVVAPGQVTAPPAKIEAMYEPQRFGLSGTEIFRAAPLEPAPDRVAARSQGF